MSRGEYAPVANEHPARSPEEEMDQAFESDDEVSDDTTPLTRLSTALPPRQPQPYLPDSTGYDFEREYDHPPPGSPPPQASALRAVGNTNGIIPDPSNVQRNFPTPASSKPSLLWRAIGSFLPRQYARLSTSDGAELRGSGVENDGVFANIQARPTRPSAIRSADGQEIQEMSEDAQKDTPPSYNEAQRDAVPPYWETTVHAPIGSSDSLLIDGLPTGTIFSFAWNFLISISFQFVGFMLTYLLHTTHAAKYGSRAGLGVTLIQYGLYSRASYDDDMYRGGSDAETGEVTTNVGGAARVLRRMWMSSNDEAGDKVITMSGSMIHDWVSFLLMTIGWFLLLSSILGFARVKRWEKSITTPTPAAQIYTGEQVIHDDAIRARINEVFLLDSSGVLDDESSGSPTTEEGGLRQPESTTVEEEHIRRDLQALGLI